MTKVQGKKVKMLSQTQHIQSLNNKFHISNNLTKIYPTLRQKTLRGKKPVPTNIKFSL